MTSMPRRRLAAFAVAALLAACGRGGEGQVFRDRLADAIDSADHIVVTEHSFEYDAFDGNSDKPLLPDDIVYDARELDASQRRSFRAAVAGVDPAKPDAVPACVFAPHHTIRFYAAAKLVSTMKICFQCGQVEWDANRGSAPPALVGGLHDLVRGIGLRPERDWAALARDAARGRRQPAIQDK